MVFEILQTFVVRQCGVGRLLAVGVGFERQILKLALNLCVEPV